MKKNKYKLITYRAQKGMIKSCPFCGCSVKPVVVYYTDDTKHYIDNRNWYKFVYAYAECINCFAKAPYVTSHVLCDGSVNETKILGEAIDIWNTREGDSEHNNISD